MVTSFCSWQPHCSGPIHDDVIIPSKSITIMGAGSVGLAVLKIFFDLSEVTRREWEIVLYEQRRNVGGIR